MYQQQHSFTIQSNIVHYTPGSICPTLIYVLSYFPWLLVVVCAMHSQKVRLAKPPRQQTLDSSRIFTAEVGWSRAVQQPDSVVSN